ncbi:conjugal transfer protein [Nocardia cyriacigeorgica]|uniref:Conjugal transfer protein n=2 Tax=Nocardia cyriacigeorgica TaxID=135487 RepID=A0A6P1D3M7_9NOCA|nr:conjugal transfer protein [Nocardia cyriacigeorgica]NEW44064.1 conjugal transfer protein [Nocardia cyriacigeorgica]NEW51083.1 conjugal transfer protein [Nocardia cyriacigeorgica]NEW54333.1 conjugal transfer protein [Nocardia cyriacigeorgica]
MAARRRRDNAVIAVLAVLAVLGGGHAIFSFLFTKPAPDNRGLETVAIVGRAQLAGTFAQDYVVTYLSASDSQKERLAQFVADPSRMRLPKAGRQVTDPAVVFVRRTDVQGGLDIWTVTVSVRIAGATNGAGARQFYRVAVSLTDGRMRALGLPAEVTPPGRGLDLATVYNTTCPADAPVSTVASGFLAAYLTGSGDITRYIAQGSGITALAPPPYTKVGVAAVNADETNCGKSGSTVRVLVSVNPNAGGTEVAALEYPLTMINNGGQWQVQTMDQVPALAQPLAVIAEGSKDQATGPTTSAPSSTAAVPPATHN